MMQVLGVQTGRVALLLPVAAEGDVTAVPSAIVKRAVPGSVLVGPLGLAGDEQADPTVHGGLEKAVYAYPSEHYAFWREHTGRPDLPYGALGENLTLSGLVETELWLGDILAIGSCVFAVSRPREPCGKLARHLDSRTAGREMIRRGITGWYLEVVQPGSLQAGDGVTLTPGPRRMSLAERQRQIKRAPGDD
jgi:MOSC domain-containing protein YiiM